MQELSKDNFHSATIPLFFHTIQLPLDHVDHLLLVHIYIYIYIYVYIYSITFFLAQQFPGVQLIILSSSLWYPSPCFPCHRSRPASVAALASAARRSPRSPARRAPGRCRRRNPAAPGLCGQSRAKGGSGFHRLGRIIWPHLWEISCPFCWLM